MRILNWIAGVLALVVALGAAYAAYELAGYSWNQVVEYRTPFGDYSRPWQSAAAPTPAKETTASPRVVLVICDGLRLDATEKMSSLRTLRQYGADMIATTAQPSLSYPTWTTILSGATPDISGVTTNWFDAAVPVETLLDVTLAAGKTAVVSAPDDFVTLFGADRAQGGFFRQWTTEYMSTLYVTKALELADRLEPSLIVVHLPDADEVAHRFGAASDEYDSVIRRIDGDIARLVGGLQDDRTVFVITSDHGHVDAGGHGGWEPETTRVPAIFAGPSARIDQGVLDQQDIAPTIAAYLGVAIPRFSLGQVRADVLTVPGPMVDEGVRQNARFATEYARVVVGSSEVLTSTETYLGIRAGLLEVRAARFATDRAGRLGTSLILGGVALLVVLVLAAFSWRALIAALCGVVVYYAAYNGLYFIVHGHQWSLAAFNTESFVQTFFYIRMAEAAVSGLVATAVAAFVYPLLRRSPRGPHERGFAAGWLSLGPATVLLAQATLAFQVAWFLWRWGADVVWALPDFKWAFKYDLDLTQVTALGAAAVLAPVVTYLVGRYHPKVRRALADRTAVQTAPGSPAGE